MDESDQAPRGVRIEAGFGQIIATVFLILVMLVLPIGGYEYMVHQEESGRADVYTLDAVQDSDGEMQVDEGRVAGISTTNTSEEKTELPIIDSIPFNGTLFIGIGLVILVIALMMTFAMIYDFRKQ